MGTPTSGYSHVHPQPRRKIAKLPPGSREYTCRLDLIIYVYTAPTDHTSSTSRVPGFLDHGPSPTHGSAHESEECHARVLTDFPWHDSQQGKRCTPYLSNLDKRNRQRVDNIRLQPPSRRCPPCSNLSLDDKRQPVWLRGDTACSNLTTGSHPTSVGE